MALVGDQFIERLQAVVSPPLGEFGAVCFSEELPDSLAQGQR